MALVRPPLDRGPGVYLQEVPSGVHTIIGVPTGVAVFIGRTASGRIDEPVEVSSFDEFKDAFGGYLADSPMAYAVEDFFLNGGSTAYIVRLFQASTGGSSSDQPPPAWQGTQLIKADPDPPQGMSPGADLKKLFAASPGKWGTELSYYTSLPQTRAADGTVTSGYSDAVKARFKTSTWDPSTDQDGLFDVTITRTSARTGKPVKTETHTRVSTNVQAGDRYLGRVLELESSLAQFQPKWDDSEGSDSAPINDEGCYTDALALLNKHVEVYNLLCIPPDVHDGDLSADVLTQALVSCTDKRAILIVDPPSTWNASNIPDKTAEDINQELGIDVGSDTSRSAAIYYPRVWRADPLLGGSVYKNYAACGIIAGIIARTDSTRGVWKAPAGLEAGLVGIQGLADKVDDHLSGRLNSIGINCLRSFAATGPVVWGARTARGSDVLSDDFKYLPVRRLTNFIETSLQRSTLWAVFEPNDEPLWAQLRLSIGTFMADLFKQGAFQGGSRDAAYFVRCDKTTTTQADIDMGIVNVQVGFAPLKPAEFVVIYIQQSAGQGDV